MLKVFVFFLTAFLHRLLNIFTKANRIPKGIGFPVISSLLAHMQCLFCMHLLVHLFVSHK